MYMISIPKTKTLQIVCHSRLLKLSQTVHVLSRQNLLFKKNGLSIFLFYIYYSFVVTKNKSNQNLKKHHQKKIASSKKLHHMLHFLYSLTAMENWF